MRGRLWLKHFNDAMNLKLKERPADNNWEKSRVWTEFMGGVMDAIGEKMNCLVFRRREEVTVTELGKMTAAEQMEGFENWKKGIAVESRERLGIDAVFTDKAEYGLHIGGTKGIEYGPFALPAAVAELENDEDRDRICYCLWKVLCVRAPVRALICYQANEKRIGELRARLEKVIWESSLMKGTDGDLLVIIGNEAKEEMSPDYFSAFEWRHDGLVKVDQVYQL